MADGKQLGLHPNENLLSAFAEHTLTEKERLSVLEHLSMCTRCRDVVFLAHQALSEAAEPSEEVYSPSPGRSRVWWWSLAATGALAALLIAIPIAVHRSRSRNNGAVSPEIVSESKVPVPPESGPVPSAKSTAQMAPADLPPRQHARSVPPSATVNGRAEGHTEIAGSVVDRSGAVISGAQVTVRSPATGAARTAVTDAQGHFDVAALPPGKYQVEISAQGFNTLRQPLTVQQSQRTSLDAKLAVGSASETVMVSASNIDALATDSASVNDKITEQDKAALPMNGRNAAPVNTAPLPPVSQASPAPSFAAGAGPQAMGGPLTSAQVINGAPPVTTFPVKDGIVQRCVATECVGRNLPSEAKAVSTAASMRTVIALDADGNVFLSGDQAEHWEQAKRQWLGKAVSVSLRPVQGQTMTFFQLGNPPAGSTHGTVAQKKAPSPAIPATFELTNDKGQVWVSTDDGKTWVVK